ncbi:MAG TPA: carboxypeptidase-like regulatory domain-containing protein [Methanocella sp.]|uniref:carboxypeptidase-like regulatory domain-containing protein n=1 Tax=Methanocella sp. TaxID=2052833 RepID=UPI002CE1BFDF|nr:carboxypeptidase-like regulatory domain-containing protein [Methanocella sp.]HTY89869.1 carboxypeptidase-like regulatory domain-containing protein [Methanocella sp.]
MRRIFHFITFMTIFILFWACLILPCNALTQGGSISGKVFFNTGQAVPEGTVVKLVNGSNESDYIAGFNVTPDQNGFYQFVNVSHGFYKVYAWSPYYAEGYSDGLFVTTNETYTSSVVLIAMPYYANITASTYHVTYGNSADITVQVNDYWGRSVGPGWQILLRTTVGMLNPDSAFTDNNGKVYSNLPWEDNTTPADITAFAISSNGSSYGLEENITVATATATPTVTASVTVTPTASPTVAPNATVTIMPTATALPTTTVTPMSTPGFMLIGALVALGLVLAFKINK